NCDSWRPSSRSPQRRIPPWYFPSLSNCSDFWNAPHRKHPSAGTRPPVLTRAQRPTARRGRWNHHGFPTTPAAWNFTHASRTRSSGISNVRDKPDNYWVVQPNPRLAVASAARAASMTLDAYADLFDEDLDDVAVRLTLRTASKL